MPTVSWVSDMMSKLHCLLCRPITYEVFDNPYAYADPASHMQYLLHLIYTNTQVISLHIAFCSCVTKKQLCLMHVHQNAADISPSAEAELKWYHRNLAVHCPHTCNILQMVLASVSKM